MKNKINNLISKILKETKLLNEKTFNIDSDVDLLYNKWGIDEFLEKMRKGEFVSERDIPQVSVESSILKTPECKKAHERNPVFIAMGYTNGNFYTPPDTQGEMGYVDINITLGALKALNKYNKGKQTPKEVMWSSGFPDSFEQEFSSTKVKSSIYHELAHWIDDSLHNKYISNKIEKSKRTKDSSIMTKTFLDTDSDRPYPHLTNHEINAQIHNIKQFKRDHSEEEWNSMGFMMLVLKYPQLYVIYNALKDDDKKIWITQLKKRMAREDLLGKKMQNT